MKPTIEIENAMPPETTAVLSALLADEAFCRELNGLASEIMAVTDQWLARDASALEQHVTDGDQGAYTLALSLGWVLGVGMTNLYRPNEPRNITIARLILAVALGAAQSADIVAELVDPEVH